MFTRKLKILLKSWISAILFCNLISCGKEGVPHPPLPKEKFIKEVNFQQIQDEIISEMDISELFLQGKISVYFIKIKNPQKKEIPTPPEDAVYKKKNLIYEGNLNEKKWVKKFDKKALGLEYNFSTFWGFRLKGKKIEEKTKIFQFLFLENPEKPEIENIKFTEEGILFELKNIDKCKNFLLKKQIENGIPVIINLKNKGGNLFLDENLSHNKRYKYNFYCYDLNEKHLSSPFEYEILYKYEFKPPPPQDVIALSDSENKRIEFKKVQKAVKYRIYENCEGESFKFLMETDKERIVLDRKNCKYGVSSINEAGLESEIVEAKEF